MSNEKRLYRVTFVNQNEVFELYVKHIYQSEMWGFLEIEDFVFGNRSDLVVDPSEERLKQQFSSVEKSYIPIQSVIRIDEVTEQGTAKVSEVKGTVSSFPLTPPRK